ncbi:MAG: glycosyltransferase family 4 protein [Gordonia sp. (in: high G+C Gram-positive bacteria)]
MKSTFPTWHPAESGEPDPSRLLRLGRRGIRAGRLIVAWIVLGIRLGRVRPRAVIFSHWRFTFEPLFVAFYSRLFPATTFSLIAHEPFPRSDAKDTSTEKSGRVLSWSFRTAWRSLDSAFVLGSRTRQLVIDQWRPRCDVAVIPHGDEDALRSVATATAIPRPSESDAVVLFFGTWTAYKGIDDLLDAFRLVRRQYPAAQLTMAGAVGADIDVSTVLDTARAVGNVETYPGYVPSEQVAALVASSRIVVAPYIRASQSGVVHLAYTFGRPVVATTVGDIEDVVTDGHNGLLVPPHDPQALSDAMLTLLRDPELSDRLGTNGQKDIDGAWAEAAGIIAETLARTGSAK